VKEITRRQAISLISAVSAGILIEACSQNQPKKEPVTTPDNRSDLERYIDSIRGVQMRYLSINEVKIPLPEGLSNHDFSLTTSLSPQEKSYFLLVSGNKSGSELVVPALFDGEIIDARRTENGINKLDISIGQNQYIIQFLFVGSGEFLAKKGDFKTLGEPILKINYSAADESVERFSNMGITDPMEVGTVMTVGLWNPQQKKFVNLNLGNILKDAKGSSFYLPATK